MLPRVKTVKTIQDYQLLIGFYNGEVRIFDVKPYLQIGIFKQLKSPGVFNSAKVIDGSIQWQNDADFCPDTLYLESNLIVT